MDQRRLAWERRAFENEQRLSRPYSEKVSGLNPIYLVTQLAKSCSEQGKTRKNRGDDKGKHRKNQKKRIRNNMRIFGDPNGFLVIFWVKL